MFTVLIIKIFIFTFGCYENFYFLPFQKIMESMLLCDIQATQFASCLENTNPELKKVPTSYFWSYFIQLFSNM